MRRFGFGKGGLFFVSVAGAGSLKCKMSWLVFCRGSRHKDECVREDSSISGITGGDRGLGGDGAFEIGVLHRGVRAFVYFADWRLGVFIGVS